MPNLIVTPSDPACQITAELRDPIPLILPFGSISLLAGAPSLGKTALLAKLLKHFRDGEPIFDHQTNPVPAIGFINADRSWAGGAGTWFSRIGYPEIRRYSMADDHTFDARRLRKKFAGERTTLLFEFIDKLKLPPYSLINVDPISLFLGGNLLDYDTCAVACHEIRQELRKRFLTMIATAHSAKLKTRAEDRYARLQDQILGSTAIFGFTDTQMYLASPDELKKPYYTFLWHSHLAPPELHFLDRDEQGLFKPWRSSQDEKIDLVMACVPENGDGVTFATICEGMVIYSKATIKRLLNQLIEDGRIERSEHGIYKRPKTH